MNIDEVLIIIIKKYNEEVENRLLLTIVEDPSIDNSYTKKYSEELNNRLNIVWYGLNWI